MSVTQISIGRFHHFHLARQLEKLGLLDQIWTGYPRFKLKDELGIAAAKIRSFPWIYSVFMTKNNLGIPTPRGWDRELLWLAHTTLDNHVSRKVRGSQCLIALSGTGLRSGGAMKKAGGTYYCDRGSAHIRFQDRILREEHARWNEPFAGVDPRMIEREETEYALADRISVPSTFVANSFIELGVPSSKLMINPYGARLERFRRIADPDPKFFTVLFVGDVSLRKGFPYLLQAFNRFLHPKKRLKVIGNISDNVKAVLASSNLDSVEFLGLVPNNRLSQHYSTANVMVLPSIEEGLAMVIGEALACGCPVIASENTGALDFFADGVEGYIIPIRSTDQILSRMQKLADDRNLQLKMSASAVASVESIGGWDSYGERWANELTPLGIHDDRPTLG